MKAGVEVGGGVGDREAGEEGADPHQERLKHIPLLHADI